VKKAKTKTLIEILTAAIMLLIPIVALASDPPALVPKTGQVTIYASGDDGDLQTGVASPNPRFTDNTDGTVTDKNTGLVWLKNANCFDKRLWADAITNSNSLNSGECGLTDGSTEGDWRLPNYKELFSLLDANKFNPALPSGHPFTIVQSDYYWSSTTVESDNDIAWGVRLDYSLVVIIGKANSAVSMWPVRGPDRDDGLDDHKDNLPTVPNPDQKDVDTNGIGDVSDPHTVYETIQEMFKKR
jgi:hypothetical protein